MSRHTEQSKLRDAKAVFCPAQLDKATGGDIKFAQEVLETFIASFRTELAQMEDAAEAKDQKALRYHARMARAGSQTVGAARIAEICLELEKEAPVKDAPTILKKLPDEMERFCCHIRQTDAFRSLPAA